MYIYVYYILCMLTDRCAVSICDAPPNGGRVTLAVFMCVVFFLWLIRPLLSGRWWLQGWWSPLTFIFQLAQSPPTWTENQWYQPMDWFKGKCYLETIDFPMKYGASLQNFQPIHWIHALKVLAQQQQEASTQSLQQAMAAGFSPPKMEKTMKR